MGREKETRRGGKRRTEINGGKLANNGILTALKKIHGIVWPAGVACSENRTLRHEFYSMSREQRGREKV